MIKQITSDCCNGSALLTAERAGEHHTTNTLALEMSRGWKKYNVVVIEIFFWLDAMFKEVWDLFQIILKSFILPIWFQSALHQARTEAGMI